MNNELRRSLESVSRSIEASAKEAAKTGDKTQSSIDKLGAGLANASAIQAVDLLTKEEIGELRKLIADDGTADDHFRESVQDPVMRGMYQQLSDLGFIRCYNMNSGEPIFFGATPKASWAIGRYEARVENDARRAAEEEARRSDDRKRQSRNTWLGFGVGLATGILGPLVASLLRGLMQSAGLPIA